MPIPFTRSASASVTGFRHSSPNVQSPQTAPSRAAISQPSSFVPGMAQEKAFLYMPPFISTWIFLIFPSAAAAALADASAMAPTSVTPKAGLISFFNNAVNSLIAYSSLVFLFKQGNMIFRKMPERTPFLLQKLWISCLTAFPYFSAILP